jgi:hypothetical protein
MSTELRKEVPKVLLGVVRVCLVLGQLLGHLEELLCVDTGGREFGSG